MLFSDRLIPPKLLSIGGHLEREYCKKSLVSGHCVHFCVANWPEGSLATAESINLCLEEISASIFGVLSSSPRDLYCDRFLLGSIQHTSNTYLPKRRCVHGCADETLVSGLWESETRKFVIKHIVIILVPKLWYQVN